MTDSDVGTPETEHDWQSLLLDCIDLREIQNGTATDSI